MKILMLEVLKTEQFDPRPKEILRPFFSRTQGIQALEIPSKQWVRPLVGFGWSHPLASHKELQTPTKDSFFCVKKMHFRRAETQEDMSRGMLESWGGVHNKHKTVLDTDHPASPRMPALASKLSVSSIPCAWSLPFCLFPSHHHWTKPNHTAEQLFGKALLHCCRAGVGQRQF